MSDMERDNIRILFVDSDENQLQSLRRNLRELRDRWDMQFVHSSGEALASMQEQPADIVVTETQLDGISGVNLLGIIQSRHPHTVRLLLSGEVFRTPSREVVSHAHQFIAKPCAAADLIALLERIAQLQTLLRDPAIESLLGGIESLPSLPRTYQRLIDALRSEHASMASIGAIVEEDISMATKVLQMVNSAFFGLPQKITSPVHAVTLLGLETITNLTLTAGVFSQVDPLLSAEFELESLWNHSIRTAGIARLLAADIGLPRGQGDIPVLAGLLHDLGKLVLATRDTQEYRLIVKYVRDTGHPLEQIESEALWCNHATVGAYLMGLWGLPYGAVEAVAYHHDPQRQSSDRPEFLVVYAANLFDTSLHQEVDLEPHFAPLTALIPAAQFNRWKTIAEDFIHGKPD